jgi:hypothetical protein
LASDVILFKRTKLDIYIFITILTKKTHSPVDLNFYSKNGEWDLISASGSKSEAKSRGGTSFSSLSYSIKLQRRPMFHIINTLFPVALMAVLIAMVFKLPVDSGEKIGFALTFSIFRVEI